MKKFSKAITAITLTTAMFFVMGCTPEEDQNNGGGNNGGNNNNGNNNTEVQVTTYTPQNITWTTADIGGDVITYGPSLSELGVCWGLEPNPTVSGQHHSTTDWHSPFVYSLTGLKPNRVYYVRAYALRGLEYYYGDEKSFITEDCNHPCVDLGLPSGTLWSTCNLGANVPESFGNEYAWGEIYIKLGNEGYSWYSYKHCNGSQNKLTKYCNNSQYGNNSFTDNLSVLQSTDDAATFLWGNDWRIPTLTEWNELLRNTTITWTINNGVKGMLFTSSNGNSLFIPAAGYCEYNQSITSINKGFYWSNQLGLDPRVAYYLSFSSDQCEMSRAFRYLGYRIRPVLTKHNND